MSVKAFELVPAVEKIVLMGEKSKTVIECLECCGRDLYIGTNDCFVVHYTIEEKIQANGKVCFKSEKQSHKYLNMRKPITALKAASAINKIFVICDGTLIFLSMFNLEILQGQGKLKGITTFCHNENPHGNNPFCVQICVAKKKQLQIYSVTEDRVIHIKDVTMSEPPIAMAMDGNFICVATSNQYNIVNYDAVQNQDLFPYDGEIVTPVIKRIGKEEFLLNGPSSLGVFVTSAGESERPPIQWNESVYSVAYSHPYVLSLSDEFITVHSILDQQPKQVLAFKGGCWLDNFDGRLYVASRTIIYGLVPIPWEKQVQALLGDKRVDEALELAKYANKAGLSKEQFNKIFKKIKIQSGFIEFAQLEFTKCKQLFQSGDLDIRELISLYPNLLPSTSTFTRAVPPLHDIADVTHLCKGQKDILTQYKLFLMKFLEEEKLFSGKNAYRLEIVTALLKLYAEMNSPELNSLIESSFDESYSADCISCLETYNRFHALGLLYNCRRQHDKALQIWNRLLSEEIQDSTFPGIKFVIDYLSNLNDVDLVWKYADCILEKDEIEGVEIFTKRRTSDCNNQIKPEAVVEYLHRFPKAVIKYLELLVFTLKIQKEKFHTHLAVLYLDNVLKISKSEDKEELGKARLQLQRLLQDSSLYRVQLLLGKSLDAELHKECAILYSKLEEHEKALKILVYELRDHKEAENYCLRNSEERSRNYRHKLFQMLLSLYLRSSQSSNNQDDMLVPAIDLLNSEHTEFDSVTILNMLPESWGVGVVNKFLKKAVRSSLHRSRMLRAEKGLARSEDLQVKFVQHEYYREPIVMTDDEICAVCNKSFVDAQFARYPNGVIAHIQCAKSRIICPVTGKIFRLHSGSTTSATSDRR